MLGVSGELKRALGDFAHERRMSVANLVREAFTQMLAAVRSSV
jgi:hypothetical protein